MEDLAGPSDEAIPLPNVSSSVLVKVLEYCDHHQNDPLPPSDSNDADDARRKATEISEWDAKFIQVSRASTSFTHTNITRSTRRCSSRSSSPPTTSTSSPSCESSCQVQDAS